MGDRRNYIMIQVLLVLAVFRVGFMLGEEGNNCCTSKTVGPHAYTLIENEVPSNSMGCKSPCVYERDGEPGTRYCFKTGDLPVTCRDSLSFVVNLKFQNQLGNAVTVTVTVNPGPQPAPVNIQANDDGIVGIQGNSQIQTIVVDFNNGLPQQCHLDNPGPGTLFVIKSNGLTCQITKTNYEVENQLDYAVTVTVTVNPGPQPAPVNIQANDDGILGIQGNSQIQTIVVDFNNGLPQQCHLDNPDPAATLFVIKSNGLTCKIL